MTRRFQLAALAPLALGACTNLQPSRYQACYEGESCSDDTPAGLEFRGTDITGEQGGLPATLAVGGTQTIRLLDPTNDLSFPVPFERSYRTDTSRPADPRFPVGTTAIDQHDNLVTVRGIADGWNYLRILAPDGELYGRTILGAEAIDRVQLRPGFAYDGPSERDDVVWAPGEHDISVALWSTPHPELGNTSDLLVDESLVLTLPGATQMSWNTIHVPAAPAGHRDLMVAGGSGLEVLDVETVDAPDTIVGSGAAEQLSIYGSTRLCFHARHQGRYVAGAQWSFMTDGGQVLNVPDADTPHSGCAYFAAQKQGTVSIHATASGYTQTLAFQTR